MDLVMTFNEGIAWITENFTYLLGIFPRVLKLAKNDNWGEIDIIEFVE